MAEYSRMHGGAEHDVWLEIPFAGGTRRVKVSADDADYLESVLNYQGENQYGSGPEAAWKQIVAAMPMSQKDKAIGAYYGLQNVMSFGKADELIAGPLAYLGAMVPGGKSPKQAYDDVQRDINDRLLAERLQRPVGEALTEGFGGFLGGKGAYDAGMRLSKLLGRRSAGKGAGQGARIPDELSAYSFTRVNPGRKVPRRLRPESDLYRSATQLGTAMAAGAGGAADYGYWSGEGDMGARGKLAAQAAPYGAVFGAGTQAAARYGPKVEAQVDKLRGKLPEPSAAVTKRIPTFARGYQALRKEPSPDSDSLQALMAEMGTGTGRPQDYEAAAEVAATARLGDDMTPGLDSTTQRTGLRSDEMLGDVGYFEPLLRQRSLVAGGETVGSAEARQRLASRSEEAGLVPSEEMAGREVDVRGDTARGLIDEATVRTDTAYAGAESRPDVIPIKRDSLIYDSLMNAPVFDDALAIARKDRGNVAGVENDYPKTKKELLDGYRNIDESERYLYEKKGWEVKETVIPGERDPVTGEPGPSTKEFRAFDPKGPNLTIRQINELNKAFGTALESIPDKQLSAPTELAGLFKRSFVDKSDALVQAGRRHEEKSRLSDAAEETPAKLLELKPEELARKLAYDGKAQEGFPFGKPRSKDQRDILEEALWDHIATQVRETKGRPPPELVARVEVLMRDRPEAFKIWKDAVANAEKYGIALERSGKAFQPEVLYGEDLSQMVGKSGRRVAEYFFSAPFAASRTLDRTLTKAKLVRDKAVNDALVDILTKTGKQRDAAERLIQQKIARQTISQQDKNTLREVLLAAVGFGPAAEGADEMPYIGGAAPYVGAGLLSTARGVGGLLGIQ
tara:strand:- start:210 stop:2762 length:2553 start_codon:yes stop_codon:yes gene_type:complete